MDCVKFDGNGRKLEKQRPKGSSSSLVPSVHARNSPCVHTCPFTVITVISGFHIQTRLEGHSALYHMLLTHYPRLRAFLDKGISDRRLNYNSSCSELSCKSTSAPTDISNVLCNQRLLLVLKFVANVL